MKILTVDTETTGLSPKINQTLTVGLLLADITGEHLKILDHDHIFIKHDNYRVQKAATAVHNININDHHKIGVEPCTACEKINGFVEKNDLSSVPLMGHNVGFDKGFLSTLFNREDQESLLPSDSIDTMHVWMKLKKQGKIPSFHRNRLMDLASHFDIDYTKAHDALADCHITAQVYHKMLAL